LGERIGYLVSLSVHLVIGVGLITYARMHNGKTQTSVVDIDYQKVPPPPPPPPASEPTTEPVPEPEVQAKPRKPVRITSKTRIARRAPAPVEETQTRTEPDDGADADEQPQAPLYAVSMDATVGVSTVAVPVAPRSVPRTKQAKKVVLPKGAQKGPERAAPAVTSLPRVVYEARASYPRAAREAGIEGRVVLVITVAADGTVSKARVVNGLGYGLDEAALVAVRQFRFKPGTVDGEPAPMELRYKYTFVLDG